MNTAAGNPLVSVVMPVYNAEKYLAESIQSVLAQTYDDIEIVCVDDCSADGSLALLEALAREHDNLKVHALKTNQGPSHARNFAIEHARGEFILPLDADDLIAPEYCQLAMNVFREDPSVAVVYSRCKRFRGDESWEWELPEYSKERMLAGNCVYVTAFYRKTDWARIGGYDECLNALEDYNFWLYFTENDRTFHKIDQCLFFYRQHGDDGHLIAAYDNGDRFMENTTNLRDLATLRDALPLRPQSAGGAGRSVCSAAWPGPRPCDKMTDWDELFPRGSVKLARRLDKRTSTPDRIRRASTARPNVLSRRRTPPATEFRQKSQ